MRESFWAENMMRSAKCLVFLLLLIGTGHTFAECTNQISLVPVFTMKAAARARNFVSYRYALNATDTLEILSHEDMETTIGPYVLGFRIERDGKLLKKELLGELPEFTQAPLGAEEIDNFFAMAVARACASEGPFYFVSLHWNGDVISPALVFLVVPSPDGYEVSLFPSLSGGTVEISRKDPHQLRLWTSLHEGECNACETAYSITEYEIRERKPVKVRQYRTRHLYTSGQFADESIRFSK